VSTISMIFGAAFVIVLVLVFVMLGYLYRV
jgi:hypothetical protein